MHISYAFFLGNLSRKHLINWTTSLHLYAQYQEVALMIDAVYSFNKASFSHLSDT